ncbi:SAM-dependent methyltransferase, MidA family [Campylobacter blaseri]|uniref:Dihydrodipicolinate reductase n=1 Tax=Campylobacter blaseri TaxID=2042961 RepID=A0A2P8R2B3_9BACT|nr:SAM-dependent methyltransferase [Campylobacter blaseri]PSM52618.1 dihydrodipicolinate reductase [Campylobacter blaseri]PSM54266.1 dihydrodipicolinate reductase [Campylobacter blaseri]QKF85917.1 SAM-dependent methyltransferase, MidA family [Campylobacter blaseri]
MKNSSKNPLKFSDFFNSWLNEHYYKQGIYIGKKGDFYTSVSVGSLFGICIAKKILSLKDKFDGKISIVEIGANEGYLLADIVQGIYTFNSDALNDFEFCIIEPHEILRKKQLQTFKEKFGDEIEIRHFSILDEAKFNEAIFISNELFDTFSCEVVDRDKMLFIDNFIPKFEKIDNKTKELAKKYKITKGEIPINLDIFLKDIYNSCSKFSFITFDYGDIKAKGDFSLRVYKNHKVYNFFEIENLENFYGKSDITYDLNFGILKNEFLKFKDVKFENYSSQQKALLDFGAVDILDILLKKGGEIAYKNGASQLKRLIYPEELGTRFKMMEFSKGLK